MVLNAAAACSRQKQRWRQLHKLLFYLYYLNVRVMFKIISMTCRTQRERPVHRCIRTDLHWFFGCLVSKLKWKICGSWQNQCGYWGTLLFFVSGLLEERELCCVDITQWKIIVVLAAISIQLYLFSIFCGDKFVMNGTTRDYTRHQIGPGGFKLRRTFKGMNGYFTAFYRM